MMAAASAGAAADASADPVRQLKQAIARGEPAEIAVAAARWRDGLGVQAGEPERGETWIPVPSGAVILTPAEARARLERLAAETPEPRWRLEMKAEELSVPLRAPASVLSGHAVAVRAGVQACRPSAEAAAALLLRAQQEAGTGGFPFPAYRGPSSAKAMQVAAAFLKKAEAAGRLEEVLQGGWIVSDAGDGGLQFDNAECGVAMLEWYAVTKEAGHLASARRAVEWAEKQPLCVNWNYNSFSVWLLARMAQATGEPRWHEAALHKARCGVIPGQLTGGRNAGRWADGHNACSPYHFIMMRALTELAAALPPEHPGRAEVVQVLRLGLRARNGEIVTRGVMNRDKAMEALLAVHRVFRGDEGFLRETQSSAALEQLAKLISTEAQEGRMPLAPCEWAQFLVWAAGR